MKFIRTGKIYKTIPYKLIINATSLAVKVIIK